MRQPNPSFVSLALRASVPLPLCPLKKLPLRHDNLLAIAFVCPTAGAVHSPVFCYFPAGQPVWNPELRAVDSVAEPALQPVSYTHLDVYKRQVLPVPACMTVTWLVLPVSFA